MVHTNLFVIGRQGHILVLKLRVHKELLNFFVQNVLQQPSVFLMSQLLFCLQKGMLLKLT